MKTKYLVGILCISWAAFALPAAAQNGRQTTPANSPMCDDLADKTPGLQGLCVALCEAQGCTGEYNPLDPDDVDYGPNCGPSAPRLAVNFRKLAERDPNRDNPVYPSCITPKCPCWSREELKDIGGFANDKCENLFGTLMLQGGAKDRGVDESATAFASATFRQCNGIEHDFNRNVWGMTSDAIQSCMTTLRDECAARGMPLP